ncbi:protein G12-like [Anopheles albimanus]|uniref:Protein G12 n=1 Tax=Anopheles albimanus TaxID=7167 RepID=A0A182FE94_ANOAL|nr:protein G12-like [Anopheles albimanus]
MTCVRCSSMYRGIELSAPASPGKMSLDGDARIVRRLVPVSASKRRSRLSRTGLVFFLLCALVEQTFGYHIRHHQQEEDQQQHHQLQQDLMDFIDLVPFEEVRQLMQYYYHYDVEVESAFDYVSTEDYTQIRQDIANLGEVRTFRRYLDSIGCSVEQLWKELNVRFDADDIFAEPDEALRKLNLTTRGLNGLVDDILALLPQDEIILLFFDKLETSNDFSYFFEQIGSGEFENVLNTLQSSQQLRILLWKLQQHGFDIPGWIQLVQRYFSFSSF